MIIPFAEWLPDLPDLQSGGARVAKNVLPHEKSYKPLASTTAVSTALDAAVRGSIALRDSAGDVYIYAGDNTKLYSFSGGTFSDVSSGAYTGAQWEFTRWGDKVIATNYNEAPQIITMGGANFAALSGSPPKARHIAVVRDFVVLGNVNDGTERSNRIQWSGINDETSWGSVPATQADYQDLQGNGGWIQAVVGGEYGVIIQDNSIWRMTYVGPPVVFQFDEVETGRGTPAPKSVVSLGNDVFYLGKDGFYVFDGNRSRNISVNKVSKTFYSDIDDAYLEFVTAAIDPINTLVIWSYHGDGHTGNPNKLIIYNWSVNRWSYAEVDLETLNYSRQSGYTLEDLDSLYSSLDDIPISLDSRYWKGGAILLAGFNTSHQLVVFTGTALNGEIETDEVQLSPGMRSLVTGARPLVDGTVTVSVGSRVKLSDSPGYTSDISPDSDGRANLFSNSRYHRFNVKTSGSFGHAQGVKAYFEPEGEA